MKLVGFLRVNTTTGQITSYFEQEPQLPLEILNIKLKGGNDAPLANPQNCGPAATSAVVTPCSSASAAGTDVDSTFNVEGCAATLPFKPSFNAGTIGVAATTAGAASSFTMTFGREDREQDPSAVQVHLPPGLLAKIPAAELCTEAQATSGTCGSESEIGSATALAGSGAHPYPLSGRVYLTGPYKGSPFGLSIETARKGDLSTLAR